MNRGRGHLGRLNTSRGDGYVNYHNMVEMKLLAASTSGQPLPTGNTLIPKIQ